MFGSNFCLLSCDDDFVPDAHWIHALNPTWAVEQKGSQRKVLGTGVSGGPQSHGSPARRRSLDLQIRLHLLRRKKVGEEERKGALHK
jgi:hypothetical protein